MLAGTQKPMLGTKLNRSHPLAKGLVGCWLFNEGVGNKVYDLSGYNNHGTPNNMAFPPTVASGWNPGKDGVGLHFDGAGDYINCGNGPSLDITDAITIEAWAKPNTIVGNHGIIGRHTGSNNAGGTVRFSDQNVQMVINIGGSYTNFFTTNTPITQDKWHHIVYVYNGSNEYIYVNSIEKATRANSGVIYTPVPRTDIGKVISQYFNGSIDGVKIYNRALNAEEVKLIYHAPYAMFEEGELLL